MITDIFENIAFTGINTDTRTLEAGNLFIALIGENVNGHDFIQEAEKKGAAGAIVSQPVQTSLPIAIVKDTIKTLGKITQRWREKFKIPVIGLTGSNGKTTTKNMIGAILKETKKPVLITEGNFNNHIGVPLTLARLNHQHAYAVIEMGMNHLREIAYLSQLAKPTTALITNAGNCHLEGVGGTLEGVATAKGEILEALPDEGIAVINADDDFAEYWKNLVHKKKQKIMTFGIENTADVQGQLQEKGFILQYQQQQIFIQLNLLGKHNILNALGAAAAALANGADVAHVKMGLEKLHTEHGRMELKTGINKQVTVIDDTYNANPFSLKAAIESILHYPQQKILVLGDMRELGEQSISLHRECGKFAFQKGIDILFATGELTKHTVKSFGENAKHFSDHAHLLEGLKPYLEKEILILVKGSRSMQMETIVQAITV